MSSVPRPGAGCCVCRIRPCHAGKHPLGDSVPLARCGQAVMGGEVAAAQGYSRCSTVGFSMARTSKQRGWQEWGARGGAAGPVLVPPPHAGVSPLHCTLSQWATSPWAGSVGGFGVLGAAWGLCGPSRHAAAWEVLSPPSCQLEPAQHLRVPPATALPFGRGAAAPADPRGAPAGWLAVASGLPRGVGGHDWGWDGRGSWSPSSPARSCWRLSPSDRRWHVRREGSASGARGCQPDKSSCPCRCPFPVAQGLCSGLCH